MKIIYKISLIAFVSATIFSCSKSLNVTPATTKVDTSKTLTSDRRLVGNWAIVTDSISYGGTNAMYHGSAGDYYKFTTFGNLFIAESFGNLVDTAIYSISSINNQVGWTNLYTRINGVSTGLITTTPPYTIVNVDSVNLVLMQNTQTSGGLRYEQLTFKKLK